MTPRPNAARIGVFAIGGLALLIAAVAVVFGGRLFAQTERVVMHFSGSVYGLQAGSPVVFRGVRLGSIKSIGVVHENGRFAVPVVAELDRDRIRNLHGDSAAGDPAVALAALVQRGLTAQLATQSLLTGQLYVDLDLRPGGHAAARSVDGMVEIPTALTRFQSLQDQLDRVDLNKMAQDVTATLAAARGLVAGPELKRTLAELAQASASLARLAATLERRAAPLADAAQATLGQAGQASVRVGTAAERVTAAADRVGSAAAHADALLAPGSPLLASVQKAADELGRSAAALREATTGESATVQDLQRAMADVSRAARAVRELADLLEQQPQALIRGRQAVP
jgi:paraquat-inducible protein B